LDFNFNFTRRPSMATPRFAHFSAAALFSLVAAGAAAAEPAAVRGTVVDSTGAAIVGATVKVIGTGVFVATDLQGRFALEAEGGRVEVSFPGFAPKTVDARAGKPLTVVLVPDGVDELVTVRGVAPARITTATRTDTLLRDVPQAVTVIPRRVIEDQAMRGMTDAIRFVPGVGVAQGEGNRDQLVFRGNSSTSDFFVDGVRDDVQHIRDLYNVERIEALKGANAMTFGRGGVGGVVNRVPRRADWSEAREVTLLAGAWDERRATADLGHAIGSAAGRVTAVFEDSGSYRDGFDLRRYGVNPTVAWRLDPNTTLRAGYERFHDDRTADRGVSSYQGLPLMTAPSQFFGDPERSRAEVTVDALSAGVERLGAVTVRGTVRYADYDKFYQNVFPGAVNAAGTHVAINAYNNATDRRNLFAQTDVILKPKTGGVAHTILLGAELGRQVNDDLRLTGYFAGVSPTTTSILVPLESPTTDAPIEFRPSATDADGHAVATVAALYVQDQVELTRHVQAVAGVRYDRFAVDHRNNRTGVEVERVDNVFSPRVGLIVKPAEVVSLYAGFTRSFLPRAGEQLSSLTVTNQALEPEEFTNYEVGAKWDLPVGLAATVAAYHLRRTNVAVADPTQPSVIHLVDAQRTRGVEAGLSGSPTSSWTVMGGYAYQDGAITSSISPTAQAGAALAQVPRHSFSLWNRYDLTRSWGLGLGVIHRGDSFTSTDNRVTLPAFTRVDAALFGRVGNVRGQVNLENVLDTGYYASAHNNNNITPGAPRALRVSLSAAF
jgi:catecholate siderophore receptor